MKTLHFDGFMGASGDMIVGALLDAGADFGALKSALDSLGVPGYQIRSEKVVKCGVSATKFHVEVDQTEKHPHRHLRHILEIIGKGNLPGKVKAASEETFRRIADCEARIHNTTPEKIHFHEVGAIDSIVDVVSAHMALYLLGIERVTSSPLHVGSGTVKCAHGVMPVPAPATALLLEGAPSYGGEVEGELVTPTGAAIITQVASSFGPMPAMRLAAIGYGAGMRDYKDRPNVLRVLLGEADVSLPAAQTIMVVETNIDDMNPELYAPLMETLLEKGAKDVFLTPVLGKKGRPAQLLTVLCGDAELNVVAETLIRHSTTLGLRFRREERICVSRAGKKVETPWGVVRVKLRQLEGNTRRAAPEYEDCRALAKTAGVAPLEVYEAALAAAVRGEWINE